jgi:hypothetical protein
MIHLGEDFLKSERRSVSVPSLPHDSSREIPPESQDRALNDARDDFQRILHPDGKFLGEEDYLDRSEQIRSLENLGRKEGWLYDWLEPSVEGGREHDITFDEESGTILKFTKPSRAAYIVDFFGGKPRYQTVIQSNTWIGLSSMMKFLER